MKIKQQKFEIEFPVNTKSSHYDESKGEQFALNVDGKMRDEAECHFRSSLMDKQVLTSSKVPSSCSNYAAAVIKNGELHVTPLHGIIQLHPSFSYLDKSDARLSKLQANDGSELSQDEDEPEATAIKVKFSGRESDRAKEAREKSFAFLQKKLSEEPWKPVNMYAQGSGNFHNQRSKLTCSSTDSDSSVYFNVKPRDYIHMLLPKTTDTEIAKPEMPSNILSMTQLRTMPISDQVRSLLVNSKLIKFSQLMALLPQDSDVQVVLRSLQQVAMLVQGCWVVKSEVLYPKETVSAHSGVRSEILCRARDYMMWCFTQNNYIVRKDITSVVKLSQEDIKEILEQMSRLRVNKGWEFIVSFDTEFVKKFPDVVQRQQMLWDAKHSSLSKAFDLGKDANLQPPKPRQRRRRRTKSGHSTSGDESSGTETAKRLASKLPINIKSEPLSPTKCVTNVHHNNNSLEERLPKSANCNSSTVTFLTSPSMKVELMNYVKTKLHSKFCVTLSQFKKSLNMMLAGSPPGHALGTGVSDALIKQSFLEAGGEELQTQWIPDGESVFVYWKVGDISENIRKAVIENYKSSARIRFGILKKKVEEAISSTLTDIEFRNILKDYAYFKNGYYQIKVQDPGT